VEKKQKTFMAWMRPVEMLRASKVFWFFFSKKNMLGLA
jgi:hypothetical protein